MAHQELILSACSSATPASVNKTASTPAIHLHDLATSTHIQAFKTSNNGPNSVAAINSSNGRGGTVWAVQENKAIAGVWAWQKDQQHLKLHLPERLACIATSPNGVWVAGGSPTGQIYMWEIASGLMLASWNAHYRAITTLSFTSDSTLLLSSSADAAVHVFMVSRLLDGDSGAQYGKPYGTLGDHNLGVISVAIGTVAGCGGGRCWTASEDGTVKMWSLQPPFDLLSTFALPAGATPSALAVDPSERFVYAASTEGKVYLIPLFQRKAQLGHVNAVGGDGPGAPALKLDAACITVESSINCLALSMSGTHLLIGTSAGEIHVHALPSHQHLRTISTHGGPITHLSTMIAPPDLVGRPFRAEDWAIMDIRNLERMRVGKSSKDSQEVHMLLRPSVGWDTLDVLRDTPTSASLPKGKLQEAQTTDSAALQEEVKQLRKALNKALTINERMWNGVVDLKLA